MQHVVERGQLSISERDVHEGVLVNLHGSACFANSLAKSLSLLYGKTASINNPYCGSTFEIFLDLCELGFVLYTWHMYTSFISNSGSAPNGWSRA